MPDNLLRTIKVARGQEPADILFKNARIVNVFSGEIEAGSVVVSNGVIAGIGDYTEAKVTIDLGGKYLVPGLIDGHTHIESSMLDIGEYARAVSTRGTTTVITDLHELTNVVGTGGIDYILKAGKKLPIDLHVMAPSCVPATHLETSGATVTTKDISRLLKKKGVIGLGEMMNFPGVLFGDDGVLDKIKASDGKVIDGHAPGITGRDLNAYVSAGIGSDHESTRLEEAREKLSRGIHIMIREGSTEKNLAELLPLVTDKTYKRCMFVVDDRSCSDLKRDGDIDAVVRKAIRLGLHPVRAIQLATINPAEYFGLRQIGAIAPGYAANLLIISNLEEFEITDVYFKGKLVARNDKALFKAKSRAPSRLRKSTNVKPFTAADLCMSFSGAETPVIEVIPGQIVTRYLKEKVNSIPDFKGDILKIVVVERHKATGNIGKGLVRGFGMKNGAIASSVAHDSHNIVCVGTSDEDIFAAVQAVIEMGGGLATVVGGKVIASLPLPVAGLMSPEPLDTVIEHFESVEAAACDIGVKLSAPFAALSFLALPVIPELKLTDLGMVDVSAFKLM
ncbi:adenine deaminase [Dehalogenimonas etheniformans]|uniref:Adenine deaminase n=1 Tax=Dehalogenimonas etheniformans TaxID=1536648 RepID=A0A2P5P988_9CHLR|nr:adenine deaminase [Dehalogenimonas etheniformans]PPD58856.1 adenine deaminase [Dehalogenimonas etheniformans]QNT76376.1 adenine deaminase [Dehalogenimonas etheniformans]